MKPTVTIDLEEYNDLNQIKRERYSKVRTISFDVHVTEDRNIVYGDMYVPDKCVTTSYIIKTDDEAVSAIAEELKRAQKELYEIDNKHKDREDSIRKGHILNVLNLNEANKKAMESIKEMSLFQFYRFKNSK